MTYGVKDICERYGVGEHTVLGWIRNGELKSIDVSRKRGGRLKWRITQKALESFELLRTHNQPQVRSRRKKQQEDEIKFY